MAKTIDKPLIVTLSLMALVMLSFAMLLSSTTSADDSSNDSSTDEISIDVPISCSLASSGNTSHTAEINNGQYVNNIGTTTLTAFCNDSAGFSIYAVGFSNDTIGNNTLTNAAAGPSYTINTGTATGPVGGADNSAWAMKLATVTSPTPAYPIIIAGSSNDPDTDNATDFSNYQAVPNTYTKVAYRTSGTDVGASAEGANLTTTYASYVSRTQPAGTYTGKVKYTLVHPYTELPPSGSTSIEDVTYMQEIATMTPEEKVALKQSMTIDAQYQLSDARDNKRYYVSKLRDGNIWMTQNLDHDIVTTPNFYTNENTDIGYNSFTGQYDSASWNPILSAYTHDDSSEYDFGAYNEEFANNPDYASIYNDYDPRYYPESFDPGELYINLDSIRYYGTYEGEQPSSDVLANGDAHYHLGNYYNWPSAVALNDVRDYTEPEYNLNRSICPAGWTLPKIEFDPETGDLASNPGTFANMFKQYGWNNYDQLLENPRIWESPFYFPLSGDKELAYGILYLGIYGLYWSPSVGWSEALGLSMQYSGTVNPDNGYPRNYGANIRCLTR